MRLLPLLLLLGAAAATDAAESLLPDLSVAANTLYDNDLVTTIQPGRTHLRFSTKTPNTGAGKLYLYGVTPANPNGTQDVMQRIWRDNGTWYDQPAGQFLYHSSHNHIHVEGWAEYRLREILPGEGVGPILVQGGKTSFCVLDLQVFDSTLPGYSATPEFTSCSSTIQGLSVGWADIYSKTLSGQNLDVTDIADGQYWLEAEVDPDDHILESDETNNVTRIKVTIGEPLAIPPDPYEPNDSRAELDTRTLGEPNSPFLGPCAPLTVIEDLTIHLIGNDDWWRFYFPATGNSTHYVRLDFLHGVGDIDMTLLDSTGAIVGVSNSSQDFELITLNNKPAGYYDLRVYGYASSTNDDYTLTVKPPSNGAPVVDVLDPPLGDVMVQHGAETYTTTWTASDPESNPTWVTIYMNQSPTFDGQEVLLPTSLHMDGSTGLYVINTSYLTLGSWYVYAEITDGGTVTGEWSDGTITLWDPAVSADLPRRESHLLPASPNPFNPRTVLRLELDRRSLVEWSIYDVRGARVRTLERGILDSGLHERIFDGRDGRGRQLASGVYYVGVTTPDFRDRQKIVLVE